MILEHIIRTALPDLCLAHYLAYPIIFSTGGLYSSLSDLSIFIRSILCHKLLDPSRTNAWLKPHSYSSSADFAYGMPWEVFRPYKLLPGSDRRIDMFTKLGGLSGYVSRIILIPEYDIGVTVLVAGEDTALKWMEEILLSKLIPGVDSIAKHQVKHKYADTYHAASSQAINSSMVLEVDDTFGLVVSSWVSNGTDFLHRYRKMFEGKKTGKAQLIPSNFRRGASGEVWRIMFVSPDSRQGTIIESCLLDDVDSLMYGGRSLEEVIFHQDANGVVNSVELPAFRITLQKGKTTAKNKGYSDKVLELMKPLGICLA